MDIPANAVKARVLLIEDEENHSELIRRAFESYRVKFDLSSVDTLTRARSFLRENKPDLVIADLVLPDGRATDLLDETVGEGRAYPVIVMTSYGGEEVAVRAMKAGAQDYVVKSGAAFEDMPRMAERALREWRLILDRKNAEAAQRESEEMFHVIASSANDGIALIDGEGVALYWNPSAERIFGYTAAEAIGHRIDELIIPPKYRDLHTKRHAAFKAANGGAVHGKIIEADGLRKSGEEFPVEISVSPIRYKGKWCAVGLIRDVTERRKAERETKRLATAIEQATDAILITDAEGTIQYVNPSFARTTGWAKEDAVGKTPSILKSGRQDKEFYRRMWAVIKGGSAWTGRLFNRRMDGSVYEEEMTIFPVTDETGSIVNFVSVKKDFSREAFLSRARDYFTSITSHELRTPLFKLQMVKSLLDGLRNSGMEAGKLDAVRTAVADSFDSLSRISYATTLLSNLATGGQGWGPRHFTLHNMVAECVQIASDSAGRNGRKVDISMPTHPCGIIVAGDPAMISKALEEIISNAVKYTPDGKSVNVICERADDNVTITVTDEGIGIPQERMAELFEPYFSLEDPRFYSTGRYKFKGGGLGLGLKIARMIVESHGGEISVKSGGENMGCAVAVTLPMAVKESD